MMSNDLAFDDLRILVTIAVMGRSAAHCLADDLELDALGTRRVDDRTSDIAAAKSEKTMQARKPPAPRFFQLGPYLGATCAPVFVIDCKVRNVRMTATSDSSEVT